MPDCYNERELFRILFEEPLASLIDGGRERVCLVIDGLDEAGTAEQNPLAETLGTYLPLLPGWIRVLVTGRPVPALIQNLGQSQQLLQLNLDGMMEDNLADVRMYFSQVLKEKLQATEQDTLSRNGSLASDMSSEAAFVTAVDDLTLRSGGIFLYAELVCQGILNGKLSLMNRDKFPDGLQNSFHSWFQWFFPDLKEFEAQFEPALGILCASDEPLPTEELQRIFRWKEKQLRHFLGRIDVLLEHGENVFGKEAVTFSHYYITEWLTDYHINRLYYVSAEDAKETMAEAFFRLLCQSPDDLTEFEASHLFRLLKDCGMKKELAEAVSSSHLFQKNTEAGKFCREWGHLDKAGFYFYQAFLAAEARNNRLTDPAARGNYCAACDRIGRLGAVRGNSKEAAKWYQKELSIARELEATCHTPKSLNTSDSGSVVETPDVLQDLITIHERQAYFQRRTGSLPKAMEHLENARRFAERLAEVSKTPVSLRILEDCYVRLGNLSQECGNLTAAAAWFHQALSIAEQLAKDKSTAICLRDLGVCYDRMARLMQEQGALAEAEAWFEKALALTKRIVKANKTVESMRDLSVCYLKLGDLAREKKDFRKAREWFEKVLDIRDHQIQTRGMPKDQRDLASIYLRIGDLSLDAGNPEEAQEWFRKALQIADHLVDIRCTWQDRQDQAAIKERLQLLNARE